jgi:phospholipase/lecithinase/hemolysin
VRKRYGPLRFLRRWVARDAIALLVLAVAACSSGGDDAAPSASAASPPAAAQPPTNATAGTPPSALFVLGDSLSDVGNAAAAADYVLNLPLDPPSVGLCNPTDVLLLRRRCDDLYYRQSRVSDGPVAVERLAAHLALGTLKPSLHVLPNQSSDGTVYAVAGAKARAAGDHDFARQVDWLLVRHAPLPADAVFVVMIGGNDAIDALQADIANPTARPRPSAAIVTSATSVIADQVERLLDFGARRLVVANVPDLAALPAVRDAARASTDAAAVLAAASATSVAFNSALAAKLDAIEASRPRLSPTPPVIRRFDLQAALAAARQALAASGSNADDACFDSEFYRASSAAQRLFHPQCAPVVVDGAPRFAGFVFFDGIHPTGAGHAAIGDALSALF